MAHARLYQPAIQDHNVRRIYRLKQHFKRQGHRMPMTVIVNRILDDFFDAEDHDTALGSARSLPITAHHVDEVST